jgi:3-oxoadipate enol-lactonase
VSPLELLRPRTPPGPPRPPVPLPPGRTVELPGRGTTFIRELPGPPGAPTLVLLHGLSANADLNWFPTYRPLGREFRVVAVDHRGHGRGIRDGRRFRLADCADDVAALADVLGLPSVVPVGFSMGGPIAQLVWHRHRERVDGLVLCATSRNFRGRPHERLLFASMPVVTAASRVAPVDAARSLLHGALAPRLGDDEVVAWASRELQRNDPRRVLEAAHAVGRFSSHTWVGGVDVPTGVVVTTEDQVVSPRRQQKLAAAIPGATVHPVDGDHFVTGRDPEAFVPALLDACRTVATRAGRRLSAGAA